MAETVGSLADKISIIELKIFHMAEQVRRKDADASHARESSAKLKVMRVQKRDLENELSALLANLASGRAELKLYRQFKMYNDPKYRMKNGK